MRISPVIFGCKGLTLTQEEIAFFKAVQPWGFILFGRNVETPEQVAALVQKLKECAGHSEVAVLIDQEGGRVRRLRPPHWAEYHSGAVLGGLYKKDAKVGQRLAWLQSRLMAFDLVKLGINVDCLPVLDIPVQGAHDVIGDRAYGHDVLSVTEMGEAAAQGMLDGGVVPVIKHIPGHGRSLVDSHKDLPRVDATLDELMETDFQPFKNLSQFPAAMTAHVIYEALDRDNPATTSPKVISDIIRGHMGFDGLLMCDDLSMNALSGDFAERTQSSFEAGCDVVLHCNGEMNEMQQVAKALPEFASSAQTRATRVSECWSNSKPEEEHALRDEFEGLCEAALYDQDPTEALS
jgi:beta-N-acetylhexosaminidase